MRLLEGTLFQPIRSLEYIHFRAKIRAVRTVSFILLIEIDYCGCSMKHKLNNYNSSEDESSASNEIKNFVQMMARGESNDGAVLRKLISTAAYKEELFAGMWFTSLRISRR